MKREATEIDVGLLLDFMSRLAQGYIACSEQTTEVELLLRRIGSAYGMVRTRVAVLPTAMFIALHDGETERVTLAEAPAQTMRLDQIAEVYALGNAAIRAELTPREGLERLEQILGKTARFGSVGGVLGHTILTLGVTMLIVPAPTNLAAAAALGAIVGALRMLSPRRAVLAVPLPVVAATLVSALVFYAMRRGLPVDPVSLLVPPLVTFLPGAMLTLGMVELAYGDMVSGASRLTTGFVQLVLLAFGLAAGATLVGFNSADMLSYSTRQVVAQPWVPWAGVLVFALGVYLHFSAPPKSLKWMLPVLLLAFASQRLAAAVFGAQISGFFGMLLATPLGYLIHLHLKGPPAMVTFLPSFWLVVPGALGLLSVTRLLSDRSAGLEAIVTVVFVIASIALGTLVGASIYKGVTEHLTWWRLQLGRAESYVRGWMSRR